MIRETEALHHANTAARFVGVGAHGRIEDWGAVVRQKNELVAWLRQSKYLDLLPNYNTVAYVEGWARLTDGGVTINGKLAKAGKVIITTGASPALPQIPSIERVPHLTSTSALELERLPKSLLVIGGGYIGCELGQMFARAGVSVTMVDIVPILSAGEPEISKALAGYLRDEEIVVCESVKTRAIRQTERGVALDISADGANETLEAEQVLVTTGRQPNTADLGLEEAGIELLPNRGIKVDDRMRTSKRACTPPATSPAATNSSTWRLTGPRSRQRTPSTVTACATTTPPCHRLSSPIRRWHASASPRPRAVASAMACRRQCCF